MCLGVPGRVTKVDGPVVTLDVLGTVRTARTDLLGEPVHPGQYVLNHLGFVTAILDERDALETLELFRQVLSTASEAPVEEPSSSKA